MSELIKADKAYYENPAISQSSLKCFIESPIEFYNSFVIRNVEVWDSPTLRFGRLYHTYILEPEIVDSKYIYCDIKIPDAIKKLVDDFYLYKNFDTAFSKSEYVEKNREKYREKLTTDETIKRYLNFLEKAPTRDVISIEDKQKCEIMKQVLVNTPILQKSLFKWDLDIEEFSEYEIFDELFGVAVKAKIDKIKISHSKKVILIFDLKTTSCKNLNAFEKSMLEYGYNIQSAFYLILVKRKFKDLIDKGYSVQFLFVPQKSSMPYQFLGLIKYSDTYNESTYNNVIIPTLKEIKRCTELNLWNTDYRYSNGITIIN